MTTAEIFSISIAFLSLLVSILTIYFSFLKPSQPRMLVGRILVAANTYIETDSGRQWGGLSFILPLTFYNWGTQGSSVYQIRLVIGRKDNPSKYFELAWTDFITFKDGGSNWESDAMAHPLAIQAKSSLTKSVKFDWSPLRGERIEFRKGQYDLRVYAWNNRLRKPKLKEKIDFYLTEENEQLYRNSVDNNLVIPIIINVGESTLQNQVSSQRDIIDKYE